MRPASGASARASSWLSASAHFDQRVPSTPMITSVRRRFHHQAAPRPRSASCAIVAAPCRRLGSGNAVPCTVAANPGFCGCPSAIRCNHTTRVAWPPPAAAARAAVHRRCAPPAFPQAIDLPRATSAARSCARVTSWSRTARSNRIVRHPFTQRASGPVAASRVHRVPSHSQVSSRSESPAPKPPKRTVTPRASSYAIPA